MSILQRTVERLVGRMKHDAGYRIVGGYGDRQLLRVLWHRGRQWMRGIPLRLRVPSIRGAVFRGRRVVVEHAAQVAAGPSLILEDGVYINALSIEGITLGANVTIARNAQLTCTGVLAEPGVGIIVGNRCAVGAGSFLGGQGGIRIGDDVILGPSVNVFSENHRFDRLDCPIRAQGQLRAAVMIGNDCWIGAGVTILAGVSLGSGCVVAAGAVVTKSVPPMSVVAGVPARVIKSRLSDSPSTLAEFAQT